MLLKIEPDVEIRLLSVRLHGERLEETVARLISDAYEVARKAHESTPVQG
jgi:hypothetical protein